MIVISNVTSFLILLILCTPCMASHLSLNDEYIKLNTNGSFARGSRVPQCPTGSRIHLLSYKYYKKVCNKICITKDYKLSAEAEINLHEACSFKAKCANMLFPITDMINIDTIRVEYKCEDLDNSFHDICSEGEQLVETEKNIILNRTGQHFVECNCFVRGEKFSMSVDDLRLQSKLGENCSLFTVSITSTRFSCEQGEVSIFKRKMENWLEDALISVILNGIDAVPQMIWITLQPHDETTAIIKCHTKTILTSSVTTILEEQYLTTHTKKMRIAKEEGKMKPDKTIPIGTASTVIVSVGLLAVLFYVRRKRRLPRQKPEDMNLEANEGENVVSSYLSDRNAVDLVPTGIRNSKGKTEVSEEERQTEDFYSCIDDIFGSKGNDSECDMNYDAAKQAQRICHSADYHHLSETSIFSLSKPTGSLRYKQVETTYEVAKCIDQHLNEDQSCTP